MQPESFIKRTLSFRSQFIANLGLGLAVILCADGVARSPEDGTQWHTKTFSFSAHELFPSEKDESGRSALVSDLPDPFASRGEWEGAIRLSTHVFGAELERYFGPLAPGSAILFDPKTETLAIRTLPGMMKKVERLAEHLKWKRPWQPLFKVYVLEADEGVLRELIPETSRQADHSFAWRK
ncbi:MAG: hypothetical protein ACAI34_07190, partial [Verrucomicrobium sp.]